MNIARSFALVGAVSLLLTGCAGTPAKSTTVSLATAKSHFAHCGTNRIHYLTLGKGKKTLVFVHGWCCNAQVWREQVPALAGKARLILIDLPGHGQSDKPQTEYTMDFFARSVLAVLRDARADRATFIGHSMGTPIICRVYALAPEKVTALVAVDGFLRRPKMEPARIDAFIAPYRTPEYREQAKQFVSAMFPNPGTEALRDEVLADVFATPQQVMCSALEGIFTTREPSWDLHDVKVPVLIINAKNPIWTADYENYARSVSTKTAYRTIDGTGHWLMLEKPAEFNETLIELLRKFELL